MSIAINKDLKAKAFNDLKSKAAKLREYHEAKTKSKFEENKTYFIVGCETINTKYGTTYVIETSKGEKFYANKKITKYLELNNLIDTAEFKPFAINTYGYKTFTNEDGEKVEYLEIQIFNTETKPKDKEKPKQK